MCRHLLQWLRRLQNLLAVVVQILNEVFALRSDLAELSANVGSLQRAARPGPPWRFDPALLSGIRDTTRATYLRALDEFYSFLIRTNRVPVTDADMDAALVDWWEQAADGHPGRLERPVAVVENMFRS